MRLFLAITGFTFFFSLMASSVLAANYINLHDPNGSNWNNNVWVKDGSYSSEWKTTVTSYSYDATVDRVFGTSSRVAYLNSNNELYVAEKTGSQYYSYYGSYTKVATGVIDAALIGDKIYVVDSNYRLKVKSGSINSLWTLLKTGTLRVSVSNNRILAMGEFDGSNAKLHIKEGGITAAWRHIATFKTYDGNRAVGNIVVSDNLIAFQGINNGVFVKEGGVTNGWRNDIWSSEVAALKVGGKRLCVQTYKASSLGSRIYCKEGSMGSSPWVLAYRDAFLNDILHNKISITAFGTYDSKVLEGSLARNTGWITIDNDGYDLQFGR